MSGQHQKASINVYMWEAGRDSGRADTLALRYVSPKPMTIFMGGRVLTSDSRVVLLETKKETDGCHLRRE